MDDVAIIGMACVFPGAPNLETYWRNIVSKVDAISEPPAEWEADMVFDPQSSDNDRVYCKRGGYLGDLARFDPTEYGVMPRSVDGGEPDHFLAMRIAYEALADAGYLDSPLHRERTEVVLGRGTYINRGYTTLVQHGLIVDQTLRILKQLHPEHSDDELRALKRELKASLPPFNAETAPGLVPNIVSGRIANRLDFMGPSFTVDAACASALIALDIALRDLRTERCDMALVGGVHASTPAPIHMIFCQLNALSRRAQIRPFDKDADGTLMGEGVGMVVLKRRADAERDGDRVYALVKAVGTASDGRALGLLAPRLEGEMLALRRAYEESGISPRSVGLIEAHGTATPVGDATEIRALAQVFGARDGGAPTCAIGSVKSMIGHTLPAAGIAGLIKAALALYHKVLPPTLHCDEPDPRLGLESTSFYVNTETRPWIHGSPDAPRRAGVNAFGFGGINAHAVLEEHVGLAGVEAVGLQRHWDSEVLVLEGETRERLLERARRIQAYLTRRPETALVDLAYTLNVEELDLGRPRHRLAVVASTPAEAERKLAHAVERLASAETRRIKDISGIYFFEEPLSHQGKLAFIFPGEGSQYLDMLGDLYMHFPEVRGWFDLMDRAFSGHTRGYLPSQIIFPPPAGKTAAGREAQERQLWQMDNGAEAVFTASQALLALLRRLGVRPQVVIGHSTGEYSALLAAGAIQVEDEQELISHVLAVNAIYEKLAAADRIPQGVLLTAGGAKPGLIASLVEDGAGAVHLAMDNCRHQVVLCVAEAAAGSVLDRLRRAGAICSVLPFNRAYHTPLFGAMTEALRPFFRRLAIAPPAVPIYSCVTAQPYPEDPDQIRELAVAQWSRQVRFRETVEAAWEAGARIFVEVGPRSNLTAFVDDILRKKPYLAVATNVPQRSGLTQLNHCVGLLAAHGAPMRLDHLYERRAPRKLTFDPDRDGDAGKAGARTMRLALGLAPLRLAESRAARETSPGSSRVAAPAPPPASLPAVTETARNGDQRTSSPSAPPGGAPRRESLPAVTGHAAGATRARAVRAYLETMEEFLATQEQVMAGLLSRAAFPAVAEPPAAVPAPCPAPAAPAAAPSPRSDMAGAAAAPGPAGSAPADPESVATTLLALVSEKTGYPIELLDPAAQMEADLGIDSIKRLEILGAFQQQTGRIRDGDLEHLSRLKTLRQVIDLIAAGATPAGGAVPAAPAPLPFIGRVLSHAPGQELVCLREIDVEEDSFLEHHTLGGRVSIFDEALLALAVMPLTMSMEILAEAAATLLPGQRVVGMKEVRAHRWMAFDDGRLTVRIAARRAAAGEVRVELREAQGVSSGDETSGSPLIEATVVLAERYPEAPVVGAFALSGERPSRWRPEALYSEGMFHGPSFRGVLSVDRWGADGIEATLGALPTAGLFRSRRDPGFVTDPVLLDAAGQLVGYWTAEHLPTGFNVFPYRLEALDLYGPALAVPERVKARARIALVGDAQVRSDIDVIDADGRLRMRLIGWEDRRFELPEALYRARIAPDESALAAPWPAPVARVPQADAFACHLVDGLGEGLLQAHGRIWQRVLAHLILSRRERELWRSMEAAERRRTEWLLGRAAAKDAVRGLLREQHGLRLCPADVEIVSGEHGQPVARGAWTEQVEAVPLISLSHTAGIAAAVAADPAACGGVGIDVERIGHARAGFAGVAFTAAERTRLAALGDSGSGEWALRFWCAKEALAKALGCGLMGRPHDIVAVGADAALGTVWLTVEGKVAEAAPAAAGRRFEVFTVRDGDRIAAISISEEE